MKADAYSIGCFPNNSFYLILSSYSWRIRLRNILQTFLSHCIIWYLLETGIDIDKGGVRFQLNFSLVGVPPINEKSNYLKLYYVTIAHQVFLPEKSLRCFVSYFLKR